MVTRPSACGTRHRNCEVVKPPPSFGDRCHRDAVGWCGIHEFLMDPLQASLTQIGHRRHTELLVETLLDCPHTHVHGFGDRVHRDVLGEMVVQVLDSCLNHRFAFGRAPPVT